MMHASDHCLSRTSSPARTMSMRVQFGPSGPAPVPSYRGAPPSRLARRSSTSAPWWRDVPYAPALLRPPTRSALRSCGPRHDYGHRRGGSVIYTAALQCSAVITASAGQRRHEHAAAVCLRHWRHVTGDMGLRRVSPWPHPRRQSARRTTAMRSWTLACARIISVESLLSRQASALSASMPANVRRLRTAR
jgi:hypothetical protein